MSRAIFRIVAALVLIAAGLSVVWLSTNGRNENGLEVPSVRQSNGAQDPTAPTSTSPEESISKPLGPGSAQRAVPIEVVGSIYSQGADFVAAATAAAEALTSDFSRETYLRWQPVYVDASSVLMGDHPVEGSMPELLSITPFPDITVVAEMTNYSVFEESGGANWTGTIHGSDGQVEIFILYGEQNPAFTIRIFDPPVWIDLYPLHEANAYLAIQQEDTMPEARID